jgi:ketosteroid isomerase-like protein
MKDTEAIVGRAYSAFNRRNVDDALALMTADVSWPKASEGGRVVGRDEVRAYWNRQWAEFDPHVEPVAMTEEEGGKIRVKARQIVKTLAGTILSDSEVVHVFTMRGRLISAMNLGDQADRAAGPSAAFARRP